MYIYYVNLLIVIFPCSVHILPYLLQEFLTCFISFGLWSHVAGSNEQNEINKKKYIVKYGRDYCHTYDTSERKIQLHYLKQTNLSNILIDKKRLHT
jgi:hypothetical protein